MKAKGKPASVTVRMTTHDAETIAEDIRYALGLQEAARRTPGIHPPSYPLALASLAGELKAALREVEG